MRKIATYVYSTLDSDRDLSTTANQSIFRKVHEGFVFQSLLVMHRQFVRTRPFKEIGLKHKKLKPTLKQDLYKISEIIVLQVIVKYSL